MQMETSTHETPESMTQKTEPAPEVNVDKKPDLDANLETLEEKKPDLDTLKEKKAKWLNLQTTLSAMMVKLEAMETALSKKELLTLEQSTTKLSKHLSSEVVEGREKTAAPAREKPEPAPSAPTTNRQRILL